MLQGVRKLSDNFYIFLWFMHAANYNAVHFFYGNKNMVVILQYFKYAAIFISLEID